MTVHLVYPHGDRISAPDAIGRHLAARLRSRYEVAVHDWDETTRIVPAPGDVLIGHPHPAPWTIFRRSARMRGWRRVIALSPYNADPGQIAWANAIIRDCDLYLAITGRYWFDRLDVSLLAHWRPKLVHLDLAVDRSEFPCLKDRFNPPGRRRILYIGHSYPAKNPSYLSQIARRLPSGTEVAWIGEGPIRIPGLRHLGRHDFREPASRRLVAEYDFLLTVGKADANPATVLEAMAWGLIPVCTPQSGYVGYEGIINVPLDDPDQAAQIINRLLVADEDELFRYQYANNRLLDEHFNWDRFASQVIQALESDIRPTISNPTLLRRLAIWSHALRSPFSPLRGFVIRHGLRSLRSGLQRRRKKPFRS